MRRRPRADDDGPAGWYAVAVLPRVRPSVVIAALFALASATAGCKPRSSIDPDEEAAREVVDANEACVLIGNGEHGAWVEGTYTSRRWLEHQGTALRGDSRSACEVAKMLKKVHKQTRTCTTREVEDFAHDACGR